MMGEGDNKGYSIYSFRSESVNGTYKANPRAWRVSGTTSGADAFVQSLADFALNYDTGEYLVTNYMAMPNTDPTKRSLGGGGDVWLMPLRKPVIDGEGSLHLGWWPAGERAFDRLPPHAACHARRDAEIRTRWPRAPPSSPVRPGLARFLSALRIFCSGPATTRSKALPCRWPTARRLWKRKAVRCRPLSG